MSAGAIEVSIGANAVAKLFLSCVSEDFKEDNATFTGSEYCARFLNPSFTAVRNLLISTYILLIPSPYFRRFLKPDCSILLELFVLFPNIDIADDAFFNMEDIFDIAFPTFFAVEIMPDSSFDVFPIAELAMFFIV